MSLVSVVEKTLRPNSGLKSYRMFASILASPTRLFRAHTSLLLKANFTNENQILPHNCIELPPCSHFESIAFKRKSHAGLVEKSLRQTGLETLVDGRSISKSYSYFEF